MRKTIVAVLALCLALVGMARGEGWENPIVIPAHTNAMVWTNPLSRSATLDYIIMVPGGTWGATSLVKIAHNGNGITNTLTTLSTLNGTNTAFGTALGLPLFNGDTVGFTPNNVTQSVRYIIYVRDRRP